MSHYLGPNLNMSPGAWSELLIKYQFSPPQERKLGQSVQRCALAKNNFLNHSSVWLGYGLSWPIRGDCNSLGVGFQSWFSGASKTRHSETHS